jgi:hypothetical protein
VPLIGVLDQPGGSRARCHRSDSRNAAAGQEDGADIKLGLLGHVLQASGAALETGTDSVAEIDGGGLRQVGGLVLADEIDQPVAGGDRRLLIEGAAQVL